LTERY